LEKKRKFCSFLHILSKTLCTLVLCILPYICNAETITFDLNGGNGCEAETYTPGTEHKLSCRPKKNGYGFAGWYTALDGGEKLKYIPVNATGDKTLYAQ